LVWRLEVKPKDLGMPVREVVLVNAQRGGISLHFNQIDRAWSPSDASSITQDTQPTKKADLAAAVTQKRETKSNALIAGLGPLAVATWYVATTGNDTTNSCFSTSSPCKTINGAIGKAAAGDMIKVAIGTYTGTGVEVVLLNKNVNLSGGWNTNFTTHSGTSTIDGQSIRRGLTVMASITSVVESFTILNGFGNAPGAAWGGGGIRNEGSLTINNCVINNNIGALGIAIYNATGAVFVLNNGIVSHNGEPMSDYIVFNGGTFTVNNSIIERNTGTIVVLNSVGTMTLSNTTVRDNRPGNAIYNNGSLTLTSSVVSGNIGSFDTGGIANGGGTLIINNSTISGNQAPQHGAGLYISGTSNVTINNSTITSNRSDNANSASSGGISVNGGSSTVTLKNSILARNTEINAPDCFGTINSAGYNIIGNDTGCTFSATTGDQVGTSVAPIDPQLGTLQNNGGPTFTHALLTNSPAINAGNPAVPGSGGNACLANDQRSVTRPVSTRCDIGSFEGSAVGIPFPLILTYTGNNTNNLESDLLCTQSTVPCTGTDPHADAAHQYAADTYNLYKNQYNRDSLDNHGIAIKSTVHHDSNYDNAFWDGDRIIYGDASGWPLADDVVAHEFTHGVTQYESNLFYYYQSGAINESFSDLWGEYYDQTNGLGTDTAAVKWQISEDILPSGAGAIRSMSDPTAFGDPDKMSSPNYYEDSADNGGVHFNSGVNNKAVFLMVDGGTFNGKTVSALGWTKTSAIYYEVNTSLLSSGADYSDLYFALQQACTNLIGQKGITAGDCAEVKDAADAVEMNVQRTPSFNVDAPYCPTGNPLTTVFSDDLESGTGNWTFTNGAFPRWQLDSSYYGYYAHSGLHSLYADDLPDEVADATAQLKPLVLPSNAYLHFAHAYSFESGYNSGDPTFYDFDGGVLEYSLNNGSTWLDAGSLIDFNGYKGTIFTGASNPLSGRSAFVGASHGYISTRLNLTPLAGQSVSFRWRMGLDEAANAGGWWVDDIKVYTCGSPSTFGDVPSSYWAWNFIEHLYSVGITGGCGNGNYCPESPVTRAQMAVFLERDIHGSSYNPPAVGGSTGFGDVSTAYWAGAWIKQLAAEGITGGCGSGNYCPESPVTRGQMAVFLLRSKYGSSYSPPAVGGSTGFTDVDPAYWAAAWIKQLVAEGITAGCGAGTYCPEAPVTRAQMAVFLVRTLNLP
jgi:thermolysin metallopeptidase-like protein/parallel beta helix pectate lyase-like protein/S-layer family protein